MKFILIGLEYVAGVIGALVVLLCLAVGGIVGIFEIPRYLRTRSM